MAEWKLYLRGDTDTEVGLSDKLQFASGGFNQPIILNQYNDDMHVDENGAGTTDLAASNNPINNKYISATQFDAGSGTITFTAATTGDCALRINFSHGSSVTTKWAQLVCYGVDYDTPPVGIRVYYWSPDWYMDWADSDGDPYWNKWPCSQLLFDDQATSTSHDFYVAITAKPTSIGAKSFIMECFLVYT